MIDPQNAFIEKINNLPPSTNADKALQDLVDAVSSLVSAKAELTGIIGTVSFTFEKAVFYQGLKALTPATDRITPAQKISSAWAQAISASKMVVPPGVSFGAPTPPTLFSAIISTTLDPDSLVLAKTELMNAIINQQPVDNYKKSDYGPAYRRAFSMLTYTVTGLNSIPPPTGPQPLTAAKCALK